MDTKYLKRVALYIAAVLFSVGMILYIGYHIYHGLTSEIKTEPARESSREFTVRADAYIFRAEVAIPRQSSAEGQLSPEKADGSHVASGSAVAKVYSNSDPAAEAQVESLKAQLDLLEGYAAANRGAKDAAEIDRRIYGVLTQMKLLAKSNDYAGVLEMRSELLAEMNERQAASGSGEGDIDALIATVESRLAAEQAKLGSVRETVYAPRSGWYYAEADGYEGVFTPAALDSLTLSSYDSLISSAPADITNTAGKLATSHLWYITVRIDAQTAAGMTEGSKYDVSFAYNGGETISMELERIITDIGAADAILVLSSGEIGKDFSFARRQTVDITAKVITGYAVPRSAVRLSEDMMGVYVFDGVRAHFRQIEVVKEFDDIYIVSSAPRDIEVDEEGKALEPYFLSQNELIIVEGKGMHDGKVIG